MASLKFRHYATESALIGSNTLQVALNAMDVGDIVFIDDTQTQYIITSKNNNVVTYSTYYGKAAITGVTGTGATRTLTFSNGSKIIITIDNVDTVPPVITNILQEGELVENSVVRNFRTTASDGKITT